MARGRAIESATTPDDTDRIDFANYNEPDSEAYRYTEGTSVSAPVITGTANLLGQYYTAVHGNEYPPSAALVKAGLIASAMNDWGTTLPPYMPDYRTGWGYPRLQDSLLLVSAHGETDFGRHALPYFKQMVLAKSDDVIEFKIFVEPENVPVSSFVCARIVVAWNDPPWVHPSWPSEDPNFDEYNDGNDADRQLVNDIDVTVTGPDGFVWKPWLPGYRDGNTLQGGPKFVHFPTRGDNRLDNVEVIDIPVNQPQGDPVEPRLGPKGIYTVTISSSYTEDAGGVRTYEPFFRPLVEGVRTDEAPQEIAVALVGNTTFDSFGSDQENEMIRQTLAPDLEILMLEPTGLTPSEREFTLCFTTVPGGVYKVERSGDLRTWTDEPSASEIIANKNITAIPFTIPIAETQRYYRVSRLF